MDSAIMGNNFNALVVEIENALGTSISVFNFTYIILDLRYSNEATFIKMPLN